MLRNILHTYYICIYLLIILFPPPIHNVCTMIAIWRRLKRERKAGMIKRKRLIALPVVSDCGTGNKMKRNVENKLEDGRVKYFHPLDTCPDSNLRLDKWHYVWVCPLKLTNYNSVNTGRMTMPVFARCCVTKMVHCESVFSHLYVLSSLQMAERHALSTCGFHITWQNEWTLCLF